jgi:hypothetical protein
MPRVYRYTFPQELAIKEVESLLVVGIGLMESMWGSARVRLQLRHYFDADRRTCVIDASTVVGVRFNRLLTALLIDSFGPENFRVERVEKESAKTPSSPPGFPPVGWN